MTPAETEKIRNGAKKVFSYLVKKAVLEDKAALGIQMYGHYRTICGVGQNEAGDIQNIYFYDPAQSQMQCETMDQMLDHFVSDVQSLQSILTASLRRSGCVI